jgi:predicted transcriptional regulator
LNRKVAAATLLTVITVSVCFTAVAYASDRPIFFSDFQNLNNLHPQLTVSVPFMVGASLHSNSIQPLDQPTRLGIYNFVKNKPGVHFRGICDSLSLSVGVAQYHLNVLEHAGLIVAYADGQNKRYFESNVFTKTDMQLISLMRHGTVAKILTSLSENGSALHRDIARSLGVSSQALTWQISQLRKTRLISAEKEGINVRYSLHETDIVKKILNLTSNPKAN